MDGSILFSGPMVKAILEGRKTQTRRLATSPLAKRRDGETLWVREKARVDVIYYSDDTQTHVDFTYLADGKEKACIEVPGHLKPMQPGKCMSMGCFKGAHRIELLVKRVWIEPLRAISSEDAIAEGVRLKGPLDCDASTWTVPGTHIVATHPEVAYMALWNSLHDKNGERWSDNPDVVALEFERTR